MEEIIKIVLVYILWILCSTLDGVRDGFMYSVKDINKSTPINEHIIFTIHRAIIALMVILAVGVSGLFMLPAFSFFHDGAYYTTRDLLTPGTYPKRWFSISNTSTALTTKYLDSWNRFGLFLISMVLVMVSIAAIYYDR